MDKMREDPDRRFFWDTHPELHELPDGTWRAEWGGHVGIGRTKEEASKEAAEKVVRAMTGPKL